MMNLRSMCMLLALVGAPALVGCSDAADEQETLTGTVATAIVAIGSDGASYQFETGTDLVFSTPMWGEGMSLSGTETTLTKRLPVGDYTLGVYPYDGTLTLLRTENGETQAMAAEWIDPQPVTVSITAGGTTNVVLNFRVEGLGDVTFDTGNLAVTMTVVHENETNAALVKEQGNVTVNSETYADSTAPYATELALGLNSSHDQSLWLASTGSWQQRYSTGVCKTVSVNALGASSLGLRRRLEQLAVGTGEICISDNGVQDWVNISLSYGGSAPADQQTFLPGSLYSFYLNVQGYVDDVFDGVTLQQSELAIPKALNPAWLYHSIYDSGTLLSDVQTSFTGTLQLEP